MAKLEIKGDSKAMRGLTFFLDGNRLNHLTSVDVSMDVGGCNKAVLKVNLDEVDIDIDALIALKAVASADIIPGFPSDYDIEAGLSLKEIATAMLDKVKTLFNDVRYFFIYCFNRCKQ